MNAVSNTISRGQWIALAIILLIAAVLRIDGIGAPSLWIDELFAMRHAAGHAIGDEPAVRASNVLMMPAPNFASMRDPLPWTRVWRSVNGDIHPPLYFLTLRFWLELFGDGDSTARMLSVSLSLLAIALLFDTCRLLHGPAPALWASAMMAIAVTQIRYAQEVRNYAMSTALLLIACNALVRIERLGPTTRRAVVLGLAAFALPLTHYLSLAALFALGLYALIQMRGAMRQWTVITLILAMTLFTALGGPLLWRQRANAVVFDSRLETPAGHAGRTIERTLTVPMRFINDRAEATPIATARLLNLSPTWINFAPALLVFIIAPLAILRRRGRDALLWLMILIASLIPPIVADALRGEGHLALIRFTLLGAPAAFAMIACCVAIPTERFRWMGHVLPLFIVALAVVALPAKYDARKPDARALAHELRSLAGPNDAIVFAGSDVGPWYITTMCDGVMRYLAPASQQSPCPVAIIDRETTVSDALLDSLRQRDHVYLIWGSQAREPSTVFPGCTSLALGEYRDFAYVLRISLPPR